MLFLLSLMLMLMLMPLPLPLMLMLMLMLMPMPMPMPMLLLLREFVQPIVGAGDGFKCGAARFARTWRQAPNSRPLGRSAARACGRAGLRATEVRSTRTRGLACAQGPPPGLAGTNGG
ncbi:hypothetical protein [Pseudoclavibacter terrae]|uniref:Uncharacterized protein n=1 Tax=Pseudoclavibacter terrae TaxID=1530195 RepID=A0A7J5B2B5_9MICO|nr:hypothetical protein [Pseudoclavibacter terrae]KAB1638111.1 hypothetical protein F8O03_06780 [Pseudoclavibacter terrae]